MGDGIYGRQICAFSDDKIIRRKDCPDCGGRGWFCENPFAEFNKRYFQCATCEAGFRESSPERTDEHG